MYQLDQISSLVNAADDETIFDAVKRALGTGKRTVPLDLQSLASLPVCHDCPAGYRGTHDEENQCARAPLCDWEESQVSYDDERLS